MPPTFTLGHILGPVAVATVLNVLVFATLWRWDRTEIRTGAPTWQVFVAIPLYGLPLLGFLVVTGGRTLTTPLQIFGASVLGEAMGAGVVYALLNAFLWSRGQPMRDRLAPMIGSMFLFALMLGITLA